MTDLCSYLRHTIQLKTKLLFNEIEEEQQNKHGNMKCCMSSNIRLAFDYVTGHLTFSLSLSFSTFGIRKGMVLISVYNKIFFQPLKISHCLLMYFSRSYDIFCYCYCAKCRILLHPWKLKSHPLSWFLGNSKRISSSLYIYTLLWSLILKF